MAKLLADAPVLILTGELDDWGGDAKTCRSYERSVAPKDRPFHLTIYPKTYHTFDAPGVDERFMGHRLLYNRKAHLDSVQRMKQFLEASLQEAGEYQLSIFHVQDILQNLGFDPEPIDGKFRLKTLDAINALRAQHDLQPVETLDDSSYRLLLLLQWT